jgi:hypothetical protein
VTNDDVIWCYRQLLGREPESGQAVLDHIAVAEDFRVLVLRFVRSPEFQQKITAAARARRQADSTP